MILLRMLMSVADFVLTTRKKRVKKLPELTKKYKQGFFGDVLHTCYGCSHTNLKGLHLEFSETSEDGLASIWKPKAEFESFPGIVHGGMSALLLDEVGGVLIQAKLNRFAFTAHSIIRYHKAVYSENELIIVARIVKKFRRYVFVNGEILDKNGRILTSMSAVYFLPNHSQFKHVSKLNSMSKEVEAYVEGKA